MASPPPVLVIQHIAEETPGAIAEVLTAAGLPLRSVRVFSGDPVPPPASELAALVVMGGPMGVYEADRFPHLRDELKLIESALRLEVPVLGVCLGSQLLAAALGARVAPAGFQEIGWFPVSLEPAARDDALLAPCPPSFTALHWHGDAFELPAGAVHLARSERTAVQAFRHGRAYGLLFHAEVDAPALAAMAHRFEPELDAAGTSSAEIAEGARRHGASLRALAEGIFGRFARLIRE